MPALSLSPRRFELARGLDPVLAGRPEQVVHAAAEVSSVALIADDYPGLRLDPQVEVGDRVRLGEPLLRSREMPEVVVSSPGAGSVKQVDRGRRRALRAVVIELEGEDEFGLTTRGSGSADVQRTLLASGLWTALRTRPHGGVADPSTRPHALFVTAMDTNPLAADPRVVLAEREQDFQDGLEVLRRLFEGALYLCRSAGSALPGEELEGVSVAEFSGPHPAGLPGTHMHWLDPVGRGQANWHVGYQDVVAIGRLFTTGKLDVQRVVALGGARVVRPRLLRTRLGANLEELLRAELESGPRRIVSGSVLSGRQAVGWGKHLGRYHLAACVLAAEDTALHGRPGPLIPVESFERVLPLDLLPVPLLRALVLGDVEAAEALGCLELVEEDLALCTYVCPGKLEYGAYLRTVLDEIARER